jgi:hypothetical protein
MKIGFRIRRSIKHTAAITLAKLLKYFFKNEMEISIALKPINIEKLKRSFMHINSDRDFVVVLQGPIPDQNSFTYLQNTLNLYRKIYPGLKIVISSYLVNQNLLKSLNSSTYDQLLLLDDDLKSNFERQVMSAGKGIEAAKIYDRKFLIKSRVDQRFTEPAALLYFKYLLETFPPNHSTSDFRILGSSFNSWLYRPLGISDMLIVGSYRDLENYWQFDDSITNYTLKKMVYNFNESWLSKISLHFESFLAARYLAINKFNFSSNPILDNFKMWRDFMLIADSNVFGHEWKKRDKVFIGNSLTKYSSNLSPYSQIEINFLSWLAMQQGEFMPSEISGFENF